MRGSLSHSVLLIVALGAPAMPASAADLPPLPVAAGPLPGPLWIGPYLSVRGGLGLLRDTSLDYVDDASPGRNVSFDPGWAIAGAVGVQATPWWRTEVELGQLANGVSTISPGSGARGSISATTLMANGYFDISNRGPVTPYVGAGFGKAWISHDLRVDGTSLTTGNATSWPWAYQIMTGANIALAPRWTAGLEYRFLGTQRGLFQDAQGLFYNAGYTNHSIRFGLTWRPL